MRRIYLDYAATTPLDPEVLAAMKPFLAENFGNPSSIHREGQVASAAVFNARKIIADELGCDYKEIVFTSSATEANNLALRGIVRAAISIHRKPFDFAQGIIPNKLEARSYKLKPKIIISAIEHESIMETARDLGRDGAEVVIIPVGKYGLIDLKKLEAAIDERTVLISVAYANNEIGVIQPISKISRIIKDFKERQGKIASEYLAMTKNGGPKVITYNLKPITYPLFHTDAAQAFQYLPCKVNELGVDLMTLSAHKIYGPLGVGGLYIKEVPRQARGINSNALEAISYKLEAIITGAGQERGMRAGTENVPGIVGFGKAVEITAGLRDKEAKRVEKLRDYFRARIMKARKHESTRARIEINGSFKNRLPNNLNIYIPGRTAHELLIALDLKGVAASAGSACNMRTSEPSPVILALGYPKERATRSLRFTLGRQTKKDDIDKVIQIMVSLLQA